MAKFIAIMILIIVIALFFNKKLVIRIDTFFRKGFALNKDVYGVYCFCGKQGDGKTYSVIDFLYSCKHKGMKVITNVKSYYDHNKDFVLYEKSFYNIISKFETGVYDENYIIFYDEIFTLLEKGKLDKSVLSFISQLRKRKIMLVTTAQEWLEINVTFRRYCRFQVDCKMFNLPIFNCAFSINEINDGYQLKWDNNENEYVAPRIKTTVKKCGKKLADSYDTYEVIDTTPTRKQTAVM